MRSEETSWTLSGTTYLRLTRKPLSVGAMQPRSPRSCWSESLTLPVTRGIWLRTSSSAPGQLRQWLIGSEWEMGLHDVVVEEARRRGLHLGCRQIPRELMKAVLGDSDVRFFELAYLELQVDREQRSVRVQLRDFMIPSNELIPDSVRS